MYRRYLSRRKLLKSLFWLGVWAAPISAWVGAWRSGNTSTAIAQTDAIAPATQTKQIDGLSVPAQFAVEISGATEAASFGPLPAFLEITAPQAEDPNPIVVSLYMASQNQEELGNGSIFWQSFVAESPQRDEHFSQVTVSNNRVQMQVSPSAENFRGDVMWFTELTGTLSEAMGGNLRSGVVPTEGTMTFTVDGGQVSGEMQLAGMTDLGVASTYQARFSGQQQ